MTHHTLTLTDTEVLETAQTGMATHIPLNAAGYACSTDDLYKVLLGAAVQRSTLEAACAELVGTPGSNTIRNYLNEQLTLEELPQLETQLNQALRTHLPPCLKRQPRVIALDMHDRPYYGKTTQEEGLWVRGRAKAGTTRFYRIATAYVVLNGLRFTLGLCFVLPDDTTVPVVATLCRYVVALGIPRKYLLLDRGFAGIEVQTYLDAQQIPAIIACPIRGKTGGTRALCHGRKSYRTQHTFVSQGGKQQRTAELALCRTFTTAKRTKRLKRRAMWQVFILIHLEMQPPQVVQVYKYRFRIETSYRCANQVRGWTTSPNPVLRFLLMALAVYLLNVWVWLRWCFTQIPRRGRRKLDLHAFRVARFARFIIHALKDHYGIVHQITAVAAPLL
ncbi:MAG TPA: hypothetical protein PKH77_26820 [Anaerolineae bacterium]|nr:hypothetical protein [Anaerolineae bacterium]